MIDVKHKSTGFHTDPDVMMGSVKEVDSSTEVLEFAKPITVPWSVEFNHETNTLNIKINCNLNIEVEGHDGKTVHGNIVTVADGHSTHIAMKEHHVQPSGDYQYQRLIEEAVPNESLRHFMMMRHEQYRAIGEEARRKEFYLRTARRNMMTKRKKSGGCGCR